MNEQNNRQTEPETQKSPAESTPKRRIQPVRVLLILLAAAILVGQTSGAVHLTLREGQVSLLWQEPAAV